MGVTGSYEVHVNVQLNGNAPEKLAAFAEARGYHYLHILLDQGQTPRQPMLSWRQAAGVDAALLDAREQFAAVQLALDPAGFEVLKLHREVVLHDSNLDLDRGW